MHSDSGDWPTMHVPTSDEAAQAVEQARLVFGRTLAGWASDMLCVRRAGLTQIGWPVRTAQAAWRQAA